MPDGPTREEEILARLAERDLTAVERVHDKLMVAEETAEIAELGRTYTRMARSLRQTLALKAKLAREREEPPPIGPGRPSPSWSTRVCARSVRPSASRSSARATPSCSASTSSVPTGTSSTRPWSTTF